MSSAKAKKGKKERDEKKEPINEVCSSRSLS